MAGGNLIFPPLDSVAWLAYPESIPRGASAG